MFALACAHGSTLRAQLPVDSGGFVIRLDADTVAIERFSRDGELLQGELLLRLQGNNRENYRAITAMDASVPLVEVIVRRGNNPPDAPPSQRTRLIFKEDSVAIDDVTSHGLETRVLQTERGAIPYLNLSFALLEQATRRAFARGADTVSVPFFNLGGGQTLVGTVSRLTADSMQLSLGTVDFYLRVGENGRIMEASIPSQRLTATRTR